MNAVGDSYRRLVAATFWATLALIVVGGVVRVSDSGLGCGAAGSGLHGWPFCGGRVVPAVDATMIVEYSHRALASAVGVLLIALVVFAWRSYRENRAVVRISTTTLVLVVAEGLLGGLTVEHGLDPWLVAAHLGISMVIAALLLLLAIKCRETPPVEGAARVPMLTRSLAIAAPVLTWSTIVAGGYVAGTERYGTPDGDYSFGAHMACGDRFPTCLGSWWPFGASDLVDAQLIHRGLMYATAVAVIGLVVIAWRSSSPNSRIRVLAVTTSAILAAQVLLGAMNVWYGEHRGMILAHLTLGTALWLLVFALGYFVARREA
ncbi:MAG: COX15/CtaA family protein [Thermoleophilaceae bacterium]|nr:COX15/CtaA family protein [Thermoleophilaceae bacterium]